MRGQGSDDRGAPLGSKLRQRLLRGDALFGVIASQQSSDLVEACALLGFDLIFLDAEHGIVTFETGKEMIRAADCAGTPVLVRVPRNEPSAMLPFLEAGAAGVIVPHVQTAADAAAAVAAVKYPPLGRRGAGPSSRANSYGLLRSAAEHFRKANDETLVVVQVEDRIAAANIANIGAVPGVDLVFIGPSDLALELGYGGQPEHPAVRSVLETAYAHARAAGLRIGTVGYTTSSASLALRLGTQLIVQSTNSLLSSAAREYLASVTAEVGPATAGSRGRDV